MKIQVKTHAILLYSLLGLAILWGPTASADPVDAVADLVLGQPNFTSNTANNGGVSASNLHRPHGVAVDTAGNVYVADLYNNRVLIYDGFLDLTPMLTCAVYDVPFATPLALKKKPNDQFH